MMAASGTQQSLDRARPNVPARPAASLRARWGGLYATSLPERRQFGQAVPSFQAIQFMLADMATQIEAAQPWVYSADRAIDSGDKNVNRIAAMAKVFATDTAMSVTTDVVQLLGGYGYCQDYPVEEYMRNTMITQVYEGTDQVQRMVIGRAITRKPVS